MRFLLPLALLGAAAGALRADTLSRSFEIDFSREVLSRDLKGLAARSDGRLLPGPSFTDLDGPHIGEILWCVTPAGKDRYFIGTGPEGIVQEIAFNPADNTYAVSQVADLSESQAMSIQTIDNSTILVGTSPTAAVYLIRKGATIARVPLPADSVFDFLKLDDGTVLAGTGNPGRIYRIDVDALARAGVSDGVADEAALAAKGFTLFAEIRDRNVRRLARMKDGRIVAGSSPKGTVYAFPAPSSEPGQPISPTILFEQRDAEIVDLVPDPDGYLYAAAVTSPSEESRIVPTRPAALAAPKPEPNSRSGPSFTGRSTVVRIPADGFAETVVVRNNTALYRLAMHDGWLVMAAGEQGDAFGYDPASRRSLVFPGSVSSQLNDMAPIDTDRFLVLRNNAPGLAVLSFASPGARSLETKRIDLGQPSEFGNLRFDHLRGITPDALQVEVRTNNGSDEVEGWTPWQALNPRDDAFYAAGIRGRYVKLRIRLLPSPGDFQIDKATLYHLPQDHRPQLADFRIFPPNLGIVAQPEMPSPPITTIAQWLSPSASPLRDDSNDRRKNPFLSSQVLPAPGTQLVYWSVNDVDGDTLAYTFSIKPEKSGDWIDLAVDTRDTYSQFEISNLPEGLYLTRLTVNEQAPRPADQRLSYTFETDNLLVDRTPPAIQKAGAVWHGNILESFVESTDALSLLEGAEFTFNNGVHETVSQPSDGIRDGRTERFAFEAPAVRAAGATSVEIIVYDQAGNAISTRVPVPVR